MEDQIIPKINSLEARITSFEERVDTRFNAVDERFNAVENTVDKIVIKVVSLEEDMKEVKSDVKDLKSGLNTVMENQDKMIKIFEEGRIERAAIISALNRHEDRIEKVENDIDKLKLQAQVS